MNVPRSAGRVVCLGQAMAQLAAVPPEHSSPTRARWRWLRGRQVLTDRALLAHLGHDVAWLSRLGGDPFGERIEAALRCRRSGDPLGTPATRTGRPACTSRTCPPDRVPGRCRRRARPQGPDRCWPRGRGPTAPGSGQALELAASTSPRCGLGCGPTYCWSSAWTPGSPAGARRRSSWATRAPALRWSSGRTVVPAVADAAQARQRPSWPCCRRWRPPPTAARSGAGARCCWRS